MTQVVPTSAQPGFHAHLCDRAAGAVLGSAQDRVETDAGQAEAGQ